MMLFILLPLVMLKLLSLLGMELGILSMYSVGPVVGILCIVSMSFLLLLLKTYTSYSRMWTMTALFMFHMMGFLVEDLMIMVFISDIMIVLVMVGFGLTSSSSKGLVSSLYLALYVTLPSSPLLAYSMYKFGLGQSSKFSLSIISQDKLGTLGVVALLLSGMGKLPMYGMHYWLPKAHVQSPTPLSMILAGLSLKLGVILLMLVLYNFSIGYFTLSVLSLPFIWSLFSSSSLCLAATDSKVFLAYCSVSHMTLSGIGILYMLIMSSWGGWMLALSHCLTSPALFYAAGKVQQESGTRNFHNPPYQKFTLLSLLFITLCLMDMPFPPVPSFWGELFVLTSILSKMGLCVMILMVPFLLMLRSYEHFFYHLKVSNYKSMMSHIIMMTSLLVFGMFL
uniref:NADH-ubiquinone oxidoreductase chain 4 n=1 Tax=Pegea confoederata TaxID=942563 RepID=A0AA86IMH4_9UROC|nr:NADH dehydrogenase subunit 4 [Pegea confoederata]